MKKILVIDTGKEWGGGTNSLLELLKRINKYKYHFTVLFYNNYKKGNNSDIKTEIEKLGIDCLLLEQKEQLAIAKIFKELIRLVFFFSKKLKKYFIFFIDYQFRIKPNAQKIIKILTDFKIDMLYMNNQPSSNLEGIIASKITGIPALQHCRKIASLNSFEVKMSNKYLSKIICVSNGAKQELIQNGIDIPKSVVVYNGIDVTTSPLKTCHEIREKWNIPDNNILIGTVGSLLKLKRIKDFIEIVDIVSKKSKLPIKCIIVGDGPEKGSLLENAKRKKIFDKVVFTGFQSDAISYINAMDIFVMTSEKEGLPRVILEAMLVGKPVVASNVTGPSELVVNGETGLLIPPKRPDMFANAIVKLIENPELRRQMGELGRKRVIENFPIEKYVKGVEKVFTEVLEH